MAEIGMAFAKTMRLGNGHEYHSIPPLPLCNCASSIQGYASLAFFSGCDLQSSHRCDKGDKKITAYGLLSQSVRHRNLFPLQWIAEEIWQQQQGTFRWHKLGPSSMCASTMKLELWLLTWGAPLTLPWQHVHVWNTNTIVFPAKMFLQVCVDGTCSPPTCSSSMPCNPLRCAGSVSTTSDARRRVDYSI